MNRRKFGLLAGSSVAAAAALRATPAMAQTATPDATLLTTTLNPLGGIRAGNADGSIPAWTGGNVTAPVPPDQPIDVPIFPNEQALYQIDASNMAQYSSLLTPGVQTLMTKFGYKIKVYPTHRTAAAPQYIYDNTAKNVSRASLEPTGGRFGFRNGYAGPPFPIPDTSDPMVAGVQIIWNHLVRWQTFQNYTKFSGSYVVTNGNKVLTFGGSSHFDCGYYDPNGSPETYDGYLSKLHEFYLAPAASQGQEAMVWTSSNLLNKPNITWTVVAGQGRIRKAPDEAYDTPNPTSNGINNYDDASGFAGSPQKYDWKCLGKQEMLVPYNCNGLHFVQPAALLQSYGPGADTVRWEKHRVWVVEATLHPGERNTKARRMLYVDEDTWNVLLADSFDANNNMVLTAAIYNRSIGSLPGTWEIAEAFWNTISGDWNIIGSWDNPPYSNNEYFSPQPATLFDPQQMAASASF